MPTPSRWPFIILAAFAVLVAAFVLLWIVPPPWSGAPPFTATVTRVYDGDSPTITYPGHPRQLTRMAQIDAPEKRQPGGLAAADHLQDLLLGREVQVYILSYDRYKRPVVQLRIDGYDVSRRMAADGHAWAFWRYLDDPLVPLLEWRARLIGDGIWALPRAERIPPWDYRHAKSMAAAEKRRLNGRK